MVKMQEMRSDLAAEREGVWATYAPGFDVKLASTATPEFEAAIAKAMEPYIELQRAGKLEPEQREDVIKGVFAEQLVKEWRGLECDDGQPTACTPAAALAMFKDPTMHRFWAWCQSVAGSEARFRAQRAERDRKN